MRRWIHEYMKGTHQLCCWQPASCSTGLAAKVEMQSCASLRWQAHTLTQQQQHQEHHQQQADRRDRGQDQEPKDSELGTRTGQEPGPGPGPGRNR